MKYWEILASNLSKHGWNWGLCTAMRFDGEKVFLVDAHRRGTRIVVRSDEILSAFVELEREAKRITQSSTS